MTDRGIIDLNFPSSLDHSVANTIIKEAGIVRAFLSQDPSCLHNLHELKTKFPESHFSFFYTFNPHLDQFPIQNLRTELQKSPFAGVRLYPGEHWFYPNDPVLYSLIRELETQGLILIFQLTPTGSLPFKLKYTDPVLIDDIASDFPSLRIILSVGTPLPWIERVEFLAKSRKNVFIELSFSSPAQIPECFSSIERLPEKFVYGSGMGDVNSLKRRIMEFVSLPYPEEVLDLILYKNAESLFLHNLQG